MLLQRQITSIRAYRQSIDMRKSFDGLLSLVQQDNEDPLSGTLYVFINKRGNYLKSIFWDRTGYGLFAKRLERGRFHFPLTDDVQELSSQVFALILDGIILGRSTKIR